MAPTATTRTAITRANLLDGDPRHPRLRRQRLGRAKLDIGGKIGSTCLIGMQVQNGKFVRVDPAEPGKFDCDNDKPPLDDHARPGRRNTTASD